MSIYRVVTLVEVRRFYEIEASSEGEARATASLNEADDEEEITSEIVSCTLIQPKT